MVAASTRAIAREAGLTEAALYRHFPTKDQLLLAVVAERLPQFIDVLKDLPGRVGKGSVAQTLQDLVQAAVLFYEHLVPILSSMFSDPELLAQHRTDSRSTGLGPHRANAALATYLRGEQASGRINPEVSADALAALLLGAAFQRGFFRSFFGDDVVLPPADRFASDVVQALLAPADYKSRGRTKAR